MKKEPTLKEQIRLLQERHDAMISRNLERERRLAALEERLKGLPELYSRVHALEQALGPVWTTASGHKVTPKLMSDNHLEATVAHLWERLAKLHARGWYPAASEETPLKKLIDAFEMEIARRAEDDHYHKLAGKVAPRVVIAKLSKWLRWLL